MNDALLNQACISVWDARDRAGYERAVVSFCAQLGFQNIAAMVVVDHPDGAPEFISVQNAPAAYRETWNDLALGRSDPVMQHCKSGSLPLVWDQSTYVQAGAADKWEHQARFGYGCGLAVAAHLPDGRHFMIGAERDHGLPISNGETVRLTASLLLFAAYAQEAALKVLIPKPPLITEVDVSARELETLRWTMEGKTAWEIGRILGLSESTVARHLHNATRKLNCTSKHQAVLRAMRLGLLG